MKRTLGAIEDASWIVICLAMVFFVFSAVIVNPMRVFLAVCVCGVLGLLIIPRLEGDFVPLQREGGRCLGLSSIVFLGLSIRMSLALTCCPGILPGTDSSGFWSQICSWSAGHFIESKSYTLTSLYAFLQYLYGAPNVQFNQIINAFLGVFQICLTYDLSKCLFGSRRIGILAAFLVAVYPTFLFLVFGLLSEPLFGVLVLCVFRVLWSLLGLMEKGGTEGLVKNSAILALLATLSFYCRGNGLFAICSTVAVLAFPLATSSKKVVMRVALPFVIIVTLLALCVGVCNLRILGHFVVSSSEDSNWPILIGSRIESKGKWVSPPVDKILIREQYAKRYPGMKFDLHKAAPLIRAEVSRRWRDDPKGMARLAITKYREMWRSDDMWVIHFLRKDDVKTMLASIGMLRSPMVLLKGVLSVLMLVSLVVLWRGERKSRLVAMAMLLFLVLNVLNHLIIESSPRYSYPLLLILPVLAPGAFLPFCRAERNESEFVKGVRE